MALKSTNNQKNQAPKSNSASWHSHASSRPDRELELDVIEQFRASLSELSDLHNRLMFMNTEIESVISRKKRS